MSAIKKPRILLDNRPRLKDHIPIQTPFVVNVDPSDKCNLRCKFCPTGDQELMMKTPGRNNGPMKMDIFRKIINDVQMFPQRLKVLRLYKDGEPLSNPHFHEMVRLAKQSECCDIIDTTTNAILLTKGKSDSIVESGLDRINISIYGMNMRQYEEFAARKVDFDLLVRNIAYFYKISRGRCVVHIKINSDIVDDDSLKVFYDIFGEIADSISDEHVMSCWPEFNLTEKGVISNQSVGIYGQPINEVLVCPYIFYGLSVNSDGTVSACFVDWQRQLLIGDVKIQSLVDIWSGEVMRGHQLLMLRGERKGHPICANCGQLRQGMPDNIDQYRKEILVQIKKAVP